MSDTLRPPTSAMQHVSGALGSYRHVHAFTQARRALWRCDAQKPVKGRKHHMLVGSLGLPDACWLDRPMCLTEIAGADMQQPGSSSVGLYPCDPFQTRS